MKSSRGLLVLSIVSVLACRCDPKPATKQVASSSHIEADSDFSPLVIADSLFQLGENYMAKNKHDSAFYFHEKALSLRVTLLTNDVKLVESNIKVATFYLKDFKYQTAVKFLEEARMMSDRVEIQPDVLIDLYFKLANCKSNMKDLPSAASLLKKTLDLLAQHDPNNKILLSRVYSSFSGVSYYDKKYSEGIEYANKAIQLTPADDHVLLGRHYVMLGMHYKELHEDEMALWCLNKSIAHDLKWSGHDSDEIAKRFLQKGFIFSDLGMIDSAKFYLSKNFRIRKKVYGEKNVNTFGAKYSLGKLLFSSGQFDSAAHFYHESIISLIKNFNEKNWFFNPRPLADEMNTDLILGLVGKASALKKIAEGDSSRTDLLKLSLRTYFLADSVFTVYRTNFIEDDPQLMQLESEYIPYDNMVDIAFTLFTRSQDLEYAGRALSIMERSRAVILQNALNRVEAYSSAGVPAELKQEENKLIGIRQGILQKLSKGNSPPSFSDSLYRKLFEIDNQHQQLLKKIETINPAYFSIKYKEQPIDIKSVMKLLKGKDAILLEYLWGQQSIYMMMVSGDHVKIKIISSTEEINKALHIVSTELKGKPNTVFEKERFERFHKNSKYLYDGLLGGLLPNPTSEPYSNPTLIISADGALALFPFEVLVTKGPTHNEVDYHLPYLINQYTISYTFSSRLLSKQAEGKRSGKKLLALGYAGKGESTQRNGFSDLPGTEKEISAIKDVMKNSANKYYLGGDVSESVFKKHIADVDIVHLAIHGLADTANALESRLIFRSESDSLEDGQLYAHELYDLNLEKLDLAVLSACESGLGKHQKGEGVMSIARGFAYAGCPSQVISLWKIDDRTTAEVMSSFYTHLSQHKAINVSLTQAKLDYLNHANEFNSHPLFWAAFLMVGDDRSVDAERDNSLTWLMLLAGIFSIASFITMKRKRRGA